MTEPNTKSDAQPAKGQPGEPVAGIPALPEKQRRELWLYIAVSIVAVELLLGVGAILYSFVGITPDASGQRVFSFPWLIWGALSLIVPTLVLLLVHSADV
ncbi:MAG: hypothetical protein LBH65_05645, partial [Desulfovibrio sp.]|nr:hypothetical protein [Desulfovibrio sp.]